MLLLVLVAMSAPIEEDPVAAALARIDALQGYRLTLRSQGSGGEEIIRYSYQQPGYVRMDMEIPYRGAVLIYRPDTGKVQLWPFGGPGSRPGLSLRPTNRMVRSSRGHRVDQSDVGTLLRNVQRLQQHGNARLLGATTINEHPVLHVVVEAEPGRAVHEVARYDLWLDEETLFPLRVISYDRRGERLESVHLEDVSLDPAFPRGHFSP
ncbi:LolA family protein [Halomonas sp. A29]|uniref:LolA family protein n=1 Tax=Halomonas sp. A29 TaxID=3102786 RepID=UPI00398A9C76